jgi:Fatty acid hydroxylase superfamily
MPLLLHNTVSFITCYAMMSFSEYFVHRFLAHSPFLLRKFPNSQVPKDLFLRHVDHHGKYYRCFNYEENEVGRNFALLVDPRVTVVQIVLFAVPIFFLDHITGLYMALLIVIHNWLYNAVHQEMHVANGRWFRKSGIFRWLEHYHFLHHQHPKKNYNGVFPLCDWLLGTRAQETETDRKVLALLRQGYIVDRKGRPMSERKRNWTNM